MLMRMLAMASGSRRTAAIVMALGCWIPQAAAHIALWDPGMYGWDPNDPNQYDPILPLYNATFTQWWFHGYVNSPPAGGQIMSLPAGGTYHGQVACNKALTTYGVVPSEQTGLYACDSVGALHTADAWQSPNPTDVKGCGIAIAYQSDVTQVQPEDFAVITVNYTCPWFKHVDFQIPADLPPCPPGGCHCMWGWVHNDDSGGEQMYFNGFRCNVTGATGTTAVPAPKTANKCHYPTDTSNCTVGAKQPHYWLQLERNNNHQDYYDPPFYRLVRCPLLGGHGLLLCFEQLKSGNRQRARCNEIDSAGPFDKRYCPYIRVIVCLDGVDTIVLLFLNFRAIVVLVLVVGSGRDGFFHDLYAHTRPTTTVVTASSLCQRRKRALEILDDPQALLRHRKRAKQRQIRRAQRTIEGTKHLVELGEAETREVETSSRRVARSRQDSSG